MFLDTATGHAYRSCFADGRSAPVHVLDGLPANLLTLGGEPDGCPSTKGTVISGFVLEGRFYSRDEAARAASHPQLH